MEKEKLDIIKKLDEKLAANRGELESTKQSESISYTSRRRACEENILVQFESTEVLQNMISYREFHIKRASEYDEMIRETKEKINELESQTLRYLWGGSKKNT